MTEVPTIEPVDEAAREAITRGRLDSTLFVEAGAGTGKTTQLVERIVHLVLERRVGLADIAAITFTEAAASELRDRIRERFEVALTEAPPGEQSELIEQALRDSDVAAISTLHSFAQRVLNEHPVAIGLPPRIEVLDEIQSQLAFDDRWRDFLNRLLGRTDIEEVLIRALLLDIKLGGRHSGLRQIARKFNDNWDRLDSLAAQQPGLRPVDITTFAAEIEELARLVSFGVKGDLLIDRVMPWVIGGQEVVAETDPAQQLRLLASFCELSGFANRGKAANWPNGTKDQVIAAGKACRSTAEEILAEAKHDVLHALAIETARFTKESAEERRREGRLEFHDLLVLARRLLRTSAEARTAIGRRYRFLLLDEFQDTDPIQIELAVLIASSLDAGEQPIERHWSDVPVGEGRLFFVGDPKQSIYRFRRAEIELFDRARTTFGTGDRSIALTQNFRTVEPVLHFINDFFGRVMPKEGGAPHNQQPAYRPLSAARSGAPGIDHRPMILGHSHQDPAEGPKITAFDLRRSEAVSVADAINEIRDRPSERPVFDSKSGTWRDPQLRDITILIPTRTSLAHLQTALDDFAIPHRADTGTLVFETQEVRDVLATLRAIDDPGDEIAAIAALRSPLFGVGDDDLFRWKSIGGDWDYRAMPPLDADPEHAVARAFAYLNAQHQQRWARSPSEVIESVVNDRRAMQIGCSDDRPRDTWGRLRFLQDQARLFFEDEGGDLRDFLAWTDLQRTDGARVHEPRLDEPDDDAVRIMTIHGSKGLEFPIVFVAGLTTQRSSANRGVGVLFPDDDGPPAIKLKADTQTQAFARRADLEESMDVLEKERLLYVALTRARDHLYLCAHHKVAKDNKLKSHAATVAAMTIAVDTFTDTKLTEIDPDLWRIHVEGTSGPPSIVPSSAPVPADFAAWREARNRLLTGLQAPRTLSATRIAQLGVGTFADDYDPDQAADADAVGEASSADSELRLWRRGRAGTAIGRAVHSVLQSLDLDTADPADDQGRAAVANLAAAQALAESVPWATDEIAATAAAVLQSEMIADLRAAKRHFKELYVAVPLGATILEGYVDLVIDKGSSLTVIDYKTDRVAGPADIEAKLDRYRLQGAAYALALELTTGRPVDEVAFLFCAPEQATMRRIDDLSIAKTQARAIAERQ